MKNRSLSLIAVVVLTISVGSCARLRPTKSEAPQSTNAELAKSAFPQRIGRVNDFAHLLESGQREELEQTLANFYQSAGIDFVVVIVDTTGGQSIFDYSLAMARDWKVGNETKPAKGLLLVLGVKDRQWRIQVSKALEKDLPDEACREYGDAAAKFYQRREYFAGLRENIRLVINHLVPAQPHLKQ
jgi:uncharacterized protein